jgi:TM2 domain-containing membrane protein YozV
MRTHSLAMGYVLWLCLGLVGVHRFYFGKRVSGALYMVSGGLLGVGWLLDLFLLPRVRHSTARSYQAGTYGYSTAWALLLTLGVLGAHRYYAGRWKSGLLYTCTLGLCGLGVLYDLACLNDLLSDANERWISGEGLTSALATA